MTESILAHPAYLATSLHLYSSSRTLILHTSAPRVAKSSHRQTGAYMGKVRGGVSYCLESMSFLEKKAQHRSTGRSTV